MLYDGQRRREMDRREFLNRLAVTLAAGASPGAFAADAPPAFIGKVVKSPEQWRILLTPAQFNVLREEGTERAFTSPLNDEKRKGTYLCAGCELPLFESRTKYDSGTGWPSFWDSLPGRVESRVETQWHPYVVKEYHCARCGGHHGHIFQDGPKPTGLRYCNNGVALKFVPA
jgi:peptide-methionine (R)-S-oxide reductase